MIIEKGKIEFSLKTQNPFVATMYHVDRFPPGDGHLKPLIRKPYHSHGDFGSNQDWHMYYGEEVPGFPAHPHRGFETVTVVMKGTVDHTDGMGSKGRYSDGDVQWMTAGKGMQHAEMFPLRNTEEDNILELFQIWLSLDSKHRMVEPAYKMLWSEDIPVITVEDHSGLKTKITLIAGELMGHVAPEPTINSWAYDKNNHLSIQLIELEAGASYDIPKAFDSMTRSLYFYSGEKLLVEDFHFDHIGYAFVTAGDETILKNEGTDTAKVLLLQSEPIPEPIVASGPFVMTTKEEIKEAHRDFKETEFGGWPFPTYEVYHDVDQVRFAKHADGRVEYPDKR